MKIVIDNITYTKIKNPSFETQTDVTSQEMPINEFSIDILTSEKISIGQYAYLYNNDDVLWAKYWIVDAVWYNDKYITIRAQSDLLLLSRAKLPAKMYTIQPVVPLIQSIFTASGLNVDIDNALSTETVTGFAPEQTARERLQWLCFVVGAYIQTDFTDRTKVIAIASDTPKAALNDIVYYRPKIEYTDWVTGIRLYAYNYFEGVPSTTDEYVQEKINDVVHTYVQSEQVFNISNPAAPQTAPENIVEIQGVTLITYGSGSATANNILNRLARYYFKHVEVSADIINNGEFVAGNQVILDEGTGEIVQGYIKQTAFSFGHNHKSSITIASADVSQGVPLNIVAECDGVEINRDRYFLPSGYIYNISNKYIDKYGFEAEIYTKTLYRPQNANASGTVGNDETTNTQEYDIALQQQLGVVSMWIVEGATATGTGNEVTIA